MVVRTRLCLPCTAASLPPTTRTCTTTPPPTTTTTRRLCLPWMLVHCGLLAANNPHCIICTFDVVFATEAHLKNRANVNTLLCLLPLYRCLHLDLLCIHSRQSMFQCCCYCLWIPIPTDIDPTSNALTWLPHCWETEGAARACWRDSSCSIIHWYGSDDSH